MGVSLTADGLKLLETSDRFLLDLDRIRSDFALKNEGGSEKAPRRIKVFCSSVLAELALPKAISTWSLDHPYTKVSVKQRAHKMSFESVVNGSCDLALMSVSADYFLKQVKELDIKPENFNIILIDRIVACISSQSSLARKESIEASDIMCHNFTYLNIGSYIHDPSNYSNIALYTGVNVEFHRRAIREQDAIALMPRYVYSAFFNDKRHACKPIEGARRTIYHVAVYPGDKPNPIVSSLVNLLSDSM